MENDKREISYIFKIQTKLKEKRRKINNKNCLKLYIDILPIKEKVPR